MKKIILVLFIFLGVKIMNVSAMDNYFVNMNGVIFSEEEYKFISDILWNGYQESMTQAEYDSIFIYGISNNIQIKELIPMMTFGNSHVTNSKSLVITKAATESDTLITVKVTWTKNPIVRSYDIIGAYLGGPIISSSVFTKVFSSSANNTSQYIKYDGNGFGVSIKLPDNGNQVMLSQVYRVTGTGTINASYQHATSNISLSNSQKYTISNNGTGGVFLFDSSISNYYDHMRGVDISV